MTAEEACRLVGEEGTFVHATLEQVLGGRLVGTPDGRAACLHCPTALEAGDDVVGYAYWFDDAIDWELGRMDCAGCGPDEVASPTLGLTEAIVTAVVGGRVIPGTDEVWLCLSDVGVDQTSPPTEGAEP